MDAKLLELNKRRQGSFNSIGNKEHTRYIVTEQPDGRVILDPAVVMTAHEAALHRNPELVSQIEQAIADPSTMVESKARRARK